MAQHNLNMDSISMNKNDFINTIAQKANINKTTASSALDAVLATIVEVLASGDSVKLPGFGSFEVSHRAATKGRNPATGLEIDIPARKLPKFSAGKNLKEAVNN